MLSDALNAKDLFCQVDSDQMFFSFQWCSSSVIFVIVVVWNITSPFS